MVALASEPQRLCQLAVERGYLNEQQVGEVAACGEEFSSAEDVGDWLVRAGLLTQQEWQDLRATWTTVHSGEEPPAGPAGEQATRDAHRPPTVHLPAPGKAPRLPEVPGYRIVQEIGHGGMGVVYKARQENPSRWVALKAMLGGAYASAHDRQRFSREIEATASLNHPGVVPVYEAGEHQGFLYYTMEFVDGDPLQAYLARHHLALRQRLELFQRICAPVINAHAHGLIHRDLKPGNIMVEKDGRPRVLDFGLAKFLFSSDGERADSLVTRAGTVVGTYVYMSPEQARGLTDQVDERSDVYSLGVILYEMLTGRLPHTGKSLDEVVRAICQDEPPRPSSLDRSLRGDLDTIILTCLEKPKERRYQSVAELCADIGRYLRIEPIRARPASTVTRAHKFVRRQRVTFIAGLLAVGLAAATGLALYYLPIYSALRRVDSADATVRATAWKELRTLAPGLGLRRAAGMLGTTSTPERALEAMNYMSAPELAGGQAQTILALQGALHAQWPEVRAKALDRLARIAPAAVVDWALSTTSSGPQAQKIEALGGLRGVSWGQRQQEVVEALKVVLDGPDAELRALAWKALAAQAPAAVPALIVSTLQLDGCAARKLEALDALGGTKPPSHDAALEGGLLHIVQAVGKDGSALEDGVVRQEAATALVALSAVIEWPMLKELLLREQDPLVGEQLARLSAACAGPGVTDALCQALQTTLADPLPVLWKPFTLELLAQIGARAEATDEVREALHTALGVHDDDIQLAAIEAIGRMPVTPADAQADAWAAPLGGLLSDGRQAVRNCALRVVCRLAAPSMAEAAAQVLERTTSGPELLTTGQLVEEMHRHLADRSPAAASRVRRALVNALGRGLGLAPYCFSFIVAEPWGSSPELSAFIGEPLKPETLDDIALQLKSDSRTIRDSAAHCLEMLTAGRIGPPGMTFEEARASIARGWRWDPSGRVFVPRQEP